MQNASAPRLKNWIVVVASTGTPMTDAMTCAAATKWVQGRNGLTGETTYICKYVGA